MSRYSLRHIDIEANHRCNLACRHCSARAGKATGSRELSAQDIKRILAGAVPLGLRKVGLTGGEPLYDVPKLEGVARFCVEELDVPVHMHTNGALVREEHCTGGRVLTLFESVSVTFLGGEAQTHDHMTRVKGSFDQALRGTKICAAAGLPLTCYYVPTHGTCAGFKNLTEDLYGIGVRRIRPLALAPSGRARPIYGQTAPTPDEARRFEDDLLEAAERLGMYVEGGYCTRLSMPRLSVLQGHAKCMSGLNRVHINWKGDVFPCTAASGVTELRLGNVGRNGGELGELWEDSELLGLIRRLHNGGLPDCGRCPQDPKCRVGCLVNACGTMPDATRRLCPLVNSRRAGK